MTSDEKLNEILHQLEVLDVLDDIVRGDPDRGTEGLQAIVKRLSDDLGEVKRLREDELAQRQGRAKLLSAVGMQNLVQAISTVGALLAMLLAVWQVAS